MKISADQYIAFKKKHEDMVGMMGDPMELMPVDLNHAYVAVNTSQEDKESKENLEKANKCNLERFGLTEAGI